MTALHLVLGIAVFALNLAAGGWGAWRWYRVEPSPAFWRLARAGQAALLAQVAVGVALLAAGERPANGLHYLYGLLPVAVAFIAEQLRVASAETVLEARGVPSARAVGELPEGDQRSIVRAIVRRELGVMTVAALVVAALALRAGAVAGGLG